METRTPFLDAIQKIPGTSAKEKYKSLNKIIKETVESKKAPGDFALLTSYGSHIPPILTPLIQVEIAKVFKNTDDVITALKSEDFDIVNRALQAKWILDGSKKNVTNFSYFETHILPDVSLKTRALLIKRLAQYLGQRNEYILAQEFFVGFWKTYNLNQAMPLLTACHERYIAEIIKDGTVNLPKKVVTRLFLKYPVLVIRYLKLCKPKDRQERSVASVSISDYLDLLPRLIPKYSVDLIDIAGSFERPLNIKLGNKRSELFLKGKCVEVLIGFPQKYLPLLQLKVVTRKLSIKQFQVMFQNLFPKNQKNFNLSKIRKYLEFQPEELHLSLITKSFKELYGVNLVSCLDHITPELLLMLPEEERKDLAQKKLADNPDFNLYNPKNSWVAYLSTVNSIPLIKDEISKSKEMEVRACLVSTLIYTCKVNKSETDLLHVLLYIASRHRNEISKFWWTVYESLLNYFDLENLSEKHWQVLNEFIQRSNVKDSLMERTTSAQLLLEKSIHYSLLNNLPIDERIILLSEIKIKCWNSEFNIIVKNPKYEKYCLETFIEIIPSKFSEDNEIWEDNKVDTIQKLTEGLYNYNERVSKAAKETRRTLNSEELLSLSKYPWLLKQVKLIVLQENQEFTEKYARIMYKIDNMKKLLLKHERSLYDLWFPPKETIARVYEQEGLNLLRREPEKILTNWKTYFESCKRYIHHSHTKRFLKKCAWYDQIPIKFVEESLREISEDDPDTLMILALLLQGPDFVKIIEPVVPNTLKMDIEGEDAKKSFRLIRSIPPAINQVNPPPSLELVGKFLKGDYLSLGLVSLMNVSCRTSVNKVITFAKALVEKPVSVKKHGIRLMCHVAPAASLHDFLRHLWNSQNHLSIRDIVFQQVYNLFTQQPSNETWLLMSSCIKDLNVKDVECFKLLVKVEKVSNEYIKDYFEAGLTKIEELAKEGLKTSVSNQLIDIFLKKATSDVCAFFPEDYCRYLVEKFVFVCSAGRMYALESFLIQAEGKLESRLKYFCNLLSTAISKNWDKPHSTNLKLYPLRRCFNAIVQHIVISEVILKIDSRIPEAMIRLFSSVLTPVQDYISYLKLFFAIELRKCEFDGRCFGLLFGTHMPNLIMTFTAEMMFCIAEVLSDFLSPLLKSPSKEGNFIGSMTESLSEVNFIHSSILAALMLLKHHTLIPDKQYRVTVENLRKLDHPAVASILNNHINSIS